MKASAVIGANFGDEGKGLVTDYLANEAPSVVVRFNGGPQAGHTVVTPDGSRHVFSHFGSGSFCGAPTFLSRFFLVNPMFFTKEYLKVYQRTGKTPKVFVDPMCPVVTPWDIMLNQAIEKDRRHGSCGMGINETVERSDTNFILRFQEFLLDPRSIRRRLTGIKNEWVRRRAIETGCASNIDWNVVHDPGVLNVFIDDIDNMVSHVKVCSWKDFKTKKNLIFEGAQGLRLDMEHDNYPHVTRSYTGLRNILKLAEEANVSNLNAYYVTRSYLTRHGNGPLYGELPGPPYIGAVDTTNVFNPHQGQLRYAYLHVSELKAEIQQDLRHARGHATKVQPSMFMTCLDQMDGDELLLQSGGLRKSLRMKPDEFLRDVVQSVGASVAFGSFGPTRRDVRKIL